MSRQNFFKQFFSGIFIVIVMTGLDQDMMQKNLSCRNLHEAQKNMYCYGFSFIPLNFLFLCLGILLIALAGQMQLELPAMNDDIWDSRYWFFSPSASSPQLSATQTPR